MQKVFSNSHMIGKTYNFFVYAAFLGPKFSMDLKLTFTLKFDDIHNRKLVTPMFSVSIILRVGRQSSDRFTSVSLLPGGFSKRALFYRLLSLLITWGAK